MMKDSNSEEPMLRIPKSAHPAPTNTKLKNGRIPVILYSAVSIALILGLVVGAKSLGWYGTLGKVSAATGEAITLGPNSVGDDIKGWMTIQQVLDATSVSRAEFNKRFAIPDRLPTSTPLSSIQGEGVSNFEVSAVRDWFSTLS